MEKSNKVAPCSALGPCLAEEASSAMGLPTLRALPWYRARHLKHARALLLLGCYNLPHTPPHVMVVAVCRPGVRRCRACLRAQLNVPSALWDSFSQTCSCRQRSVRGSLTPTSSEAEADTRGNTIFVQHVKPSDLVDQSNCGCCVSYAGPRSRPQVISSSSFCVHYF